MNKLDPDLDALFSMLLAKVRDGAPKNHIAEVFECAFRNSGAGSSERDPFYLTPTEQYNRETGAFLSRVGRAKSAGLIEAEESWFTTQDRDNEWIESQDPKHWK